jgi:hypothetical protein
MTRGLNEAMSKTNPIFAPIPMFGYVTDDFGNVQKSPDEKDTGEYERVKRFEAKFSANIGHKPYCRNLKNYLKKIKAENIYWSEFGYDVYCEFSDPKIDRIKNRCRIILKHLGLEDSFSFEVKEL